MNIIIIGKNITEHEAFKKYIQRHLLSYNVQIQNTLYLDNYYDIDLISLVKEQKSSQICIFASLDAFNYLCRILSSYFECSSFLNNNAMIPEICTEYENNSYLINISDKNINILLAKPNETLSPLLFNKNENIKYINIFDFQQDQLKAILTSISDVYNITFEIIQIVDKWHKIKLTSDFSNINNFLISLSDLIPNKLVKQEDVISYLIETFDKKDIFVTFAESCTGGLLSSYFTSRANASSVFLSSVVTYCNDAKHNFLKVPNEDLFEHGAVSEEVVSHMLSGALLNSPSHYAIAISGIAGPSGATKDKKVGCVYIGVADKTNQDIQQYDLNGDRMYIQEQAVLIAIKMLFLFFSKAP